MMGSWDEPNQGPWPQAQGMSPERHEPGPVLPHKHYYEAHHRTLSGIRVFQCIFRDCFDEISTDTVFLRDTLLGRSNWDGLI